MIGKVPRSGSGFRGLVNYLVHGPREAPDAARVAWSATRNMLVDDLELAPRLMRAVAKQSVRCRRPVYHMVISWHQDENPSHALMKTVAEATLADLALDEHQAILIAHRDTAHRHLHIVANRVHPATGKTWHASMDYARIERSLRRQAEAMNMPYVPGRFNDPDRFKTASRNARDPEVQASMRTGSSPQPRWSKAEVAARRPGIAALFEMASTWTSLRQVLAAEGLVLAAKGQGIVIVGADGTMKLSDLGKNIRLAALEERFGETFQSSTHRLEAHATSRDKGTTDEEPLSEDHKARYREAMRLARASNMPAASTSDDDPPAAETAPARFLPPTHRQPGARRVAELELHAAHESYALAKQLAAAGLAGPREVATALATLRRAKDQRRRYLTLAETFVADIGEALRPASTRDAARPQSTPSRHDPAWKRRRRGRVSKHRRDDRER